MSTMKLSAKTKAMRFLLSVVVFSSLSIHALAREDIQEYSLEEGLNTDAAKEKLSGDVTFYFGRSVYPEPSKNFGTFKISKKTNVSEKSEEEACQWAFLSAMIALQDKALAEGGNAVVDIQSNYDNNLTESNTSYKCGAGKMIAGVALQGRVVKLPE